MEHKSDPIAVNAYLGKLRPDRRHAIEWVRERIGAIWPGIQEGISDRIPAYLLDGHPFLSIADRKNYIALYIVPHDLLHVFRTELRQYDHGRSCIRFKKLDPQLMTLIERIIRYTGSQLSTSRYFKGPNEGTAELAEAERESDRSS